MRAAFTRWARTLAQRALERRYNVETERAVRLEEVGLDGPERLEYQPTPWRAFKRMLPASEVGEDDVFLDLGCGMGRAVLLAARYPFKRVIGVELAPELAEIARQNVQRARARVRAGEVEIVTSDALTYSIPDDLTILYLYNPFTGATFQHVVDDLLASHERAPRRIRVIYRHPTQHELLEATGRFALVRTLDAAGGGTARTHFYEMRPAG